MPQHTSVEPLPLPLYDVLENTAAWLAVFESINLYDAELRAVRLYLRASQSAELDLYLPGEFAVRVPIEQRKPEYCITVRCTEISSFHADDIGHQVVVGDYAFDSGSPDERAFRIRGALGGNIEVRCKRIEIARVESGAPSA